MVAAAWDTSSLVALFKDGKQCASCCGEVFTESDCDCFSGDAWDVETEYTEGELVVHEGIYYNCVQANTGIEPPNAAWWLDISPFGGPGKHPAQITITVFGVITCESFVRDINGTYILDYDPRPPTAECRYSTLIPAGGGFEPVSIIVNLDRPPNPAGIGIASIGSNTIFENDGGISCLLRQVFANVYTECNWPSTFPFNVGYDGTAEWVIGPCPAWDSGDSYGIGDCVGHEGVFYRCVAPHSNQEPPNILYWELY